MALKTIYYIACDPETFARDAWALSKKAGSWLIFSWLICFLTHRMLKHWQY